MCYMPNWFNDYIFMQYGEENVTEIVNNNMEASQDSNVEELENQDYELYAISKEKTEKQQLIIERQQTHTEVYIIQLNINSYIWHLVSFKTLYLVIIKT